MDTVKIAFVQGPEDSAYYSLFHKEGFDELVFGGSEVFRSSSNFYAPLKQYENIALVFYKPMKVPLLFFLHDGLLVALPEPRFEMDEQEQTLIKGTAMPFCPIHNADKSFELNSCINLVLTMRQLAGESLDDILNDLFTER